MTTAAGRGGLDLVLLFQVVLELDRLNERQRRDLVTQVGDVGRDAIGFAHGWNFLYLKEAAEAGSHA